jgi:hypothetical protein
MSTRSDHRWRSIAKWLRIVGGVSWVCAFLSFLVLVQVYYPFRRPEAPQPRRGFTTGLTWTHPVRYGTPQDESRSQCLFELVFPAFGLIIAAELIKIYKLGDYSGLRGRSNPPWTHR